MPSSLPDLRTSCSISWGLKRRVPVIKAFPLMLLRGTRRGIQWCFHVENEIGISRIDATTGRLSA